MACTKLCRSGSTNISRLVLNQGIFRLSVIGEITPCMHTYYRKTFLLCFLFQSSGNIGRGTFTFRIPVSKIPQRVFHRNDRDIISCFIRYPNNVSFTSCIRAILKRYDTFQLVIGIYISLKCFFASDFTFIAITPNSFTRC